MQMVTLVLTIWLERVSHLAMLPSKSCTGYRHTGDGGVRLAAGVGVNEGSRPHRTLDIANVEAALTEHGALLISHLVTDH